MWNNFLEIFNIAFSGYDPIVIFVCGLSLCVSIMVDYWGIKILYKIITALIDWLSNRKKKVTHLEYSTNENENQ